MGEGAGETLELAPSYLSPNPLKKKQGGGWLIHKNKRNSKVSLSSGPNNTSHVGNVGAWGPGGRQRAGAGVWPGAESGSATRSSESMGLTSTCQSQTADLPHWAL